MGKVELWLENRNLIVQGRLCRVAHVDGEGYKFLADPKSGIAALRDSGARADLFTFLQELEAAPRYSYPFDWDNFAVLPISTFDQWWSKQIGFKARNKAKQAEKKGTVIREVPFDDALVRGIWEIYNEVPVRQGRRFPHYGKSLEAVRSMSATFLDSSVFIGAFDGDKLIGFIKLTMNDARNAGGSDAYPLAYRLSGQSADERSGRAGCALLCRSRRHPIGICEFCVRKEVAQQLK